MDERSVAVAGFEQCWRELFQACPGHVWHEAGGVVRAATGIPIPPFNGIWSFADEVSAEDVLRAVDEMATGELPWNVQLRPGYPAELEQALADRGLVHVGDIPFMAVEPGQLVQRPSPLVLREAVTFDDVSAHLGHLEAAFGMQPEVSRQAMPMAIFFLPGSTTWLGSTDGTEVTTALQYDVDASSGIFNVATPEEHRGHGYGGAATARAAQAAFDAGARCVWLQSSPIGESVYRGLGFRTLEHWRQWMPAAYAS